MNARRRFALLGFGLALAGAVAGCEEQPPEVAGPQPPVVPVSQPVRRDVTDYVDFTGRTDAKYTVTIVPRVTGYLVKMPFKEGSLVKEGELLFEVDPRPYKAQLDQAQGQVKLDQAQLKYAQTTLARDREVAKTPGAVSPQQLDQDRAAVAQAEASAEAAEKAVKVALAQYEGGKVDFNTVGVVEQTLVTQQNLLAQAQGNVALGLIQVYRALGGGWQIRCTGCEPTGLPARNAPRPPDEELPTPRPLPGADTPAADRTRARLGMPS